MDGRRITDDIERGDHRLARRGQQRRRGVVIQIDPARLARADPFGLSRRCFGHYIGQAHRLKVAGRRIGQTLPETMGQALFSGDATVLFAVTAREMRFFLDRSHDVEHRDLAGRARQAIAAQTPAGAFDQAGAAQVEKQLFEVRKGQLLTFGDLRQGLGRARILTRDVRHRHDRITPTRRKFHGLKSPELTSPQVVTQSNTLAFDTLIRAKRRALSRRARSPKDERIRTVLNLVAISKSPPMKSRIECAAHEVVKVRYRAVRPERRDKPPNRLQNLYFRESLRCLS